MLLTLDAENADEVLHRTALQLAPESRSSLLLKTDAWERLDPRWWLVQITVGACLGKTLSDICQFCVLSQTDRNTYIQTAYSGNGEDHAWRLEWRVTADDGSYTHYYATERIAASRKAQTVSSLGYVIDAFSGFLKHHCKIHLNGMSWIFRWLGTAHWNLYHAPKTAHAIYSLIALPAKR